MSEELLVEINDGVMVMTLNRPEAKNAVTKAMAEKIAATMDEFEASDEVHVAVLTGAGGAFCAGMDLKGFVKGELPTVPGRGFGGMTQYVGSKPIIAAVEGVALAGGLELALACDLIVCAEKTRFGIPEVKRGLVAAAGGLLRLPRQIPPRIAMEYALTGDFFDAARAYELGLINRVVGEGEALQEALAIAKNIAANGPLAVKASKEIIVKQSDWKTTEAFAEQMDIARPVIKSEDAKEGARAFAEKRQPNWQGK
ncbi:crotonase/enoyl-CoA hydratase family protein [Maricurvus nonylphenolicus]|uniref:crotonase/enoyl-CoA hydratase family protein n=1 Tax=Maricurvus nonylphenolicus TaxID=1008307 RepID=UPI0036F340E4